MSLILKVSQDTYDDIKRRITLVNDDSWYDQMFDPDGITIRMNYISVRVGEPYDPDGKLADFGGEFPDVVPVDVRKRWFFIIVIPITKDGKGPADLYAADKLTWEVWNREMVAQATFDNLPDAIAECEKRNKNYYRAKGMKS